MNAKEKQRPPLTAEDAEDAEEHQKQELWTPMSLAAADGNSRFNT